MANINKLYATVLLIRSAIFTAKETEALFSAPAHAAKTSIAPAEFSAALAYLDSFLRPDSTLELLFEKALSPAAPFLLYRLKRNGFSGCRAVVTRDGILLTAMR